MHPLLIEANEKVGGRYMFDVKIVANFFALMKNQVTLFIFTQSVLYYNEMIIGMQNDVLNTCI